MTRFDIQAVSAAASVFIAGAAMSISICLALPANADEKCERLAPTNAQNMDDSFKGKIDGEIKGILSRLAGGSASI